MAKPKKGGWRPLYAKNRKTIGSNPNLIRPGEKLSMPDGSTHVVKKGENLTRIANGASKSKAKPKAKPAPAPAPSPASALSGRLRARVGARAHSAPAAGTLEGARAKYAPIAKRRVAERAAAGRAQARQDIGKRLPKPPAGFKRPGRPTVKPIQGGGRPGRGGPRPAPVDPGFNMVGSHPRKAPGTSFRPPTGRPRPGRPATGSLPVTQIPPGARPGKPVGKGSYQNPRPPMGGGGRARPGPVGVPIFNAPAPGRAVGAKRAAPPRPAAGATDFINQERKLRPGGARRRLPMPPKR